MAFKELESLYGPLTALETGMQSRVYLTAEGDKVIKVYRNQRGDHWREASNMRRADLGDWVIAALDADNIEALVMRRFDGKPITALQIQPVLDRLHTILTTLHTECFGMVNVQRVIERLLRFRSALAPYPLDDLFHAVELPLAAGLLHQRAHFCHLDLWYDNILVSDDHQVLIIDWAKADWDDPLRDIALLKTGTLDLLSVDASLQAALRLLPDQQPLTLTRFRAYIALTTLHDLYWLLMNEPYEFDQQSPRKLRRARHVLSRIPLVLAGSEHIQQR